MRSTNFMFGVVALCVSIADAQTPTGAKEMFGGGGDSSVIAFSGEKQHPQSPKPLKHNPEANQAAESKHSCGLSFSIELEEAPGQPGIQVSQARTFHSGERIRLHFKTNTDGNLSIVQLGSSGTSATLFPDSARGLANNTMSARVDHILPSENHWFRFDDSAGTEKLLVFFAKDQPTLDRAVPIRPVMNQTQTAELMVTNNAVSGSKDLVIETVNDGTYAVNKKCDIVAMEIELRHR